MAFSIFKIPVIVILLFVSFYAIVSIATSSWQAEKTGAITLSGFATNKIVLSVLTIAMLLVATYFVQMWRIENRLESEIGRIAADVGIGVEGKRIQIKGDPLCSVTCLYGSVFFETNKDLEELLVNLERKYTILDNSYTNESGNLIGNYSLEEEGLYYGYGLKEFNGGISIGTTTNNGIFDF